jgi:hypothetical protein
MTGSGKRKPVLQKSIEELESYIKRRVIVPGLLKDSHFREQPVLSYQTDGNRHKTRGVAQMDLPSSATAPFLLYRAFGVPIGLDIYLFPKLSLYS